MHLYVLDQTNVVSAIIPFCVWGENGTIQMVMLADHINDAYYNDEEIGEDGDTDDSDDDDDDVVIEDDHEDIDYCDYIENITDKDNDLHIPEF